MIFILLYGSEGREITGGKRNNVLHKDDMNSMDRANKQRGYLKEIGNKKNTYSWNQLKVIGNIMRRL